MKNKWLSGIFLTLAALLVLAVVGVIAFRAGMAFAPAEHMRWGDQLPRMMPGVRSLPYYHNMPFFGLLWNRFPIYLVCLVPLVVIGFVVLAFRLGSQRGMRNTPPSFPSDGIPPHLVEWHTRFHEEQQAQATQPAPTSPGEPPA